MPTAIPKSASRTVIFSLYRSYLRQIRLLPHNYLRQFFSIKAADDVQSILSTTDNEKLCRSKLRRVTVDLRKLNSALVGRADAFEHILDVAYGRKGSLRWEIIKPLLSDPNAPPAPRIVPNYEKSRPPVYSPELTALLTSTHSRTTKPLRIGNLQSPPIIPERANPFSEEARLLGPFSKRREVNLHWRYFKREWHKVLPPLQLSFKTIPDPLDVLNESSDKNYTARTGVRGIGLQGGGVLEEAQSLAGPAWKPLTTPRRARRGTGSHTLKEGPFSSALSTRWLRKRYQILLGRVPILTYSSKQKNGDNHGPTSRYEVTLPPSAISPSTRYGADRLPPIDDGSLSWIQLAAEEDKKRKTESV